MVPLDVALISAGIKIILAIGVILTAVPMTVWLERKVVADIQARIGPSRVGPFGLLQSFADGIKLVTKEAILPSEVDRFLYFLAPIVVMIPALAVAAVIPFGAPVQIGDWIHPLIIASVPVRAGAAHTGPVDMPVGFLFVLAITSLGVYGIVLSGWSSNNKYSLLGGLRSAAQMVSYELPMGLSVVAGVMIASYYNQGNLFSLSLGQVVDAQAGWFWNWTALNWRFAVVPGLLAATTFFICGLAETNRAPFDLPEAETELVGGYHTEYSGLKFAMFFLAEYAAMLNVAAITITLFLGGWHGFYPDPFPRYSIASALHGVFWFVLKAFIIMVVYIWIRGTLPRLRYDRLMGFAWKRLLPITLLNVLFIATWLTIVFPSSAPATLNPPPAATTPGTAPGSPPGTPPAIAPGTAPGSPLATPGSTPGATPVPLPGTPQGNVPPHQSFGGLVPPNTPPTPGTPPPGEAPPATAPGSSPAGNAPAPAPPAGVAPQGASPLGVPGGTPPGGAAAPTAPGAVPGKAPETNAPAPQGGR